jgi:hypothetical protein
MMNFIFSAMILQIWATMIFGGLLYWLPTIIALARGSDSRLGIAVLNFFLGWTVIGWIAAVIWAVGSTTGYRGPSVILDSTRR